MYRSFAKIVAVVVVVEVYEVVGQMPFVVVVSIAMQRLDYVLIIVADCGDDGGVLLYFVQWCPHT